MYEKYYEVQREWNTEFESGMYKMAGAQEVEAIIHNVGAVDCNKFSADAKIIRSYLRNNPVDPKVAEFAEKFAVACEATAVELGWGR